jgi:RNA polymerase sigma-70 factor (ECF subfamily)
MSDAEPADLAFTQESAAPPGHAAAGEAFPAFYRATLKPLTGFLILHGASLTDAADVAHDTLTLAYERWGSLHTNPRAWAFQVASRDWARRHFRVREDLTADPPEPSPVLRAVDIEHWELHLDIVQVLHLLPPRQRQVMAWRCYGYQPTDIARELGISPDDVRSNLHKARRALARHLAGEEDIT